MPAAWSPPGRGGDRPPGRVRDLVTRTQHTPCVTRVRREERSVEARSGRAPHSVHPAEVHTAQELVTGVRGHAAKTLSRRSPECFQPRLTLECSRWNIYHRCLQDAALGLSPWLRLEAKGDARCAQASPLCGQHRHFCRCPRRRSLCRQRPGGVREPPEGGHVLLQPPRPAAPPPGRPLTTCLRQKSPSGPWSSTFSRRSEFALSVFLLEGESERHSVLKLKAGNASRSQETRRQMGLFLYVTVNCCLARGLPGGRSYLSCAPAVLVWGTGILPHAPVTAVVSALMRG